MTPTVMKSQKKFRPIPNRKSDLTPAGNRIPQHKLFLPANYFAVKQKIILDAFENVIISSKESSSNNCRNLGRVIPHARVDIGFLKGPNSRC